MKETDTLKLFFPCDDNYLLSVMFSNRIVLLVISVIFVISLEVTRRSRLVVMNSNWSIFVYFILNHEQNINEITTV